MIDIPDLDRLTEAFGLGQPCGHLRALHPRHSHRGYRLATTQGDWHVKIFGSFWDIEDARIQLERAAETEEAAHRAGLALARPLRSVLDGRCTARLEDGHGRSMLVGVRSWEASGVTEPMITPKWSSDRAAAHDLASVKRRPDPA